MATSRVRNLSKLHEYFRFSHGLRSVEGRTWGGRDKELAPGVIRGRHILRRLRSKCGFRFPRRLSFLHLMVGQVWDLDVDAHPAVKTLDNQGRLPLHPP